MADTVKVNTVRKHYRTGRSSMGIDRVLLLKGLGIRVPESVVQAVIDCCSGRSGLSLYQLYTNKNPTFQAGKPTIYKIKRLYDSGALMDYVKYLDYDRMESSSEVVAPTQLTANRSFQEAISDGLRQGFRVQFPPHNFAPAFQRYLDNEQAKLSKALEKLMENYSLKLWGDNKIGTVNLSRVERSH
jgi:hypothetical protein